MKISLIKATIYTILFAAALDLTSCASQPETLAKVPNVAQLGHKPSRYVFIQRDKRLPVEFSALFKQMTRQALPNFDVEVDEGLLHDVKLTRADWVMTVRATRVKANYTYQPSSNSAINGINDCVWGSALGIGLVFAPCLFNGDEDFLETTLRDAQGRHLQTYQEKAEESGFIWLLIPSVYIENLNEQNRWKQQINALYQKVAKDKVFEDQK